MQLTPKKIYKYKLNGQWYIGELDDIGYLHPLAVSPEENGQFEPVSVMEPICTGEVDIIIAKEVQSIQYKNVPYLAPVVNFNRIKPAIIVQEYENKLSELGSDYCRRLDSSFKLPSERKFPKWSDVFGPSPGHLLS